jgi:hypothetical protein
LIYMYLMALPHPHICTFLCTYATSKLL